MKGSIQNGAYIHRCGKRLFAIYPDSVLVNFSMYCQKCRQTVNVTIVHGKIVREQDET